MLFEAASSTTSTNTHSASSARLASRTDSHGRAANGTWEGPIGEPIAKAIAEGYTSRDMPFHGYFYKVLKGQGPAAPLGQLDYVIEGVMIGGFALVASPAQYRVTGVKTFMVSNDGVVYEKDLGPDTLEQFKKMERLTPTYPGIQLTSSEDEARGN